MNLATRLQLLIGFFALLLLSNAVFIYSWVSGVESSSTEVNMAGRQRMLSQKITKEALLSRDGLATPQSLNKSVALFESSLRDLTNGSQEKGISKHSDPKLLDQLKTVNTTWQEYKTLKDRVISGAQTAEIRAFNTQSEKLLRESNGYVKLLEAHYNTAFSNLITFAIVAFILSVVAAVAAVWYVRVAVMKKIESIGEVASKIVKSKDLNAEIKTDGNDELAQTSIAFNEMIASFCNFTRKARDTDRALLEQVTVLSDASSRTRQSIEQQKDEITQVSVATTEMSSTVNEVARNTQAAADTAKRTSELALNGHEAVQRSLSIATSLAGEARTATDSMSELAQASNSIGSIADTISTIAEQTNLLALNAAIEAARAGAQGRGFAVVADEVRTLAKRTQEATSEIHNMIAALQTSTDACLSVMENSKTKSEEGVEHTNTMASAFNEIMQSVNQINDINAQIAVATEEQSQVAEEISRNVINIEDKASKTMEDATTNHQSIESIVDITLELQNSLSEYK